MVTLPQLDRAVEWHDWTYDPPIKYGLDTVEAYRPDGLYGWETPKTIKSSDNPTLNVAGLHWRVPTPTSSDRKE